MKKILFRKLLIDYLSFFLIALLGSSIVVWVFQAVNYLDIMIEDGRDYTIYINYSLLNFPKILSKLFPFVHTLNSPRGWCLNYTQVLARGCARCQYRLSFGANEALACFFFAPVLRIFSRPEGYEAFHTPRGCERRD